MQAKLPNGQKVNVLCFCVFMADRDEIEFLDGVFSSKQKADERLTDLRRPGVYCYGNKALASVRPVIIDKPAGADPNPED